jgi:hypothetical protein
VTRARRGQPRHRAALLVGFTVLLLGAGATAGHALWASTATTATNVRSASVAVTEAGFDKLAGELTAAAPARTTAVVVTNAGSTAGAWKGTITTAPTNDADRALASGTMVTAWASTTGTCAASTSPASGAVTGSWASPPALSGTLSAGATATWCVRAVGNLSKPATAKVDATLTTVLGTGAWTGRDTSRAVQTTTAPVVTGGFRCTPTDGDWYVFVSWDASTAAQSESYGVMVNGTRIATTTGYYPMTGITRDQVPTTLAPDGTVKVTVDLQRNGVSVRQVASGTIVAFTNNGTRGFRCS